MGRAQTSVEIGGKHTAFVGSNESEMRSWEGGGEVGSNLIWVRALRRRDTREFALSPSLHTHSEPRPGEGK